VAGSAEPGKTLFLTSFAVVSAGINNGFPLLEILNSLSVANCNSPRLTQKAPPAGLPVPTAELPSAQRSCRPTTNRRMEAAGDAAAASKNHVGLAAPSQARTVQLKEAPRMRKGFFFPPGPYPAGPRALLLYPSNPDSMLRSPAQLNAYPPFHTGHGQSFHSGILRYAQSHLCTLRSFPVLRQGMSMTCIGKKGSIVAVPHILAFASPIAYRSILCGNSEAVRRPKNSISIVWWITSAP